MSTPSPPAWLNKTGREPETILKQATPVELEAERGTLFVTSQRVVFATDNIPARIAREVHYSEITKQLRSKPEANKVKLHFQTQDADGTETKVPFTFKAHKEKATEDRDAMVAVVEQKMKEKKAKIPKDLPEAEQIRLRALNSDKKLLNLHRELVGGGIISEEEFWETHMAHLGEQPSGPAQATGLGGQLLDVRPDSNRGANQLVVTLSTQQIAAIMRVYPGVAKAYRENVPEKMREEEFWKRFIQSQQFYEKAKQQKAEDIFVRAHHEEEKEYEEELKQTATNLNTEGLYDLRSDKVSEYYEEGGTGHDVNAVLRRVNMQSNMVMESNERTDLMQPSRSSQTPSSRKRMHPEVQAMLALDDLQAEQHERGSRLRLENERQYFQAFAEPGSDHTVTGRRTEQLPVIAANFIDEIFAWTPNLQNGLEDKEALSVLLNISNTNVEQGRRAKDHEKMVDKAVPGRLVGQQTVVQELLRHYWANVPVTSRLQATKVVRIMDKLGEVEAKLLAEEVAPLGVDIQRLGAEADRLRRENNKRELERHMREKELKVLEKQILEVLIKSIKKAQEDFKRRKSTAA